jgi:hypothetical protein
MLMHSAATTRGLGKEHTVVTKVIERVDAHYEVEDLPMSKVYRWCPESVVIVCEHCTKTTTLTTSKRACAECGANYRALLEEVGLEASLAEQEEEVVSHPWRSLRPYYEPIRGA